IAVGILVLGSIKLRDSGPKNEKSTALPGAGGVNGYLLATEGATPVDEFATGQAPAPGAIAAPVWLMQRTSVKGVEKDAVCPVPKSAMPLLNKEKGAVRRFCKVSSSSERL